MELYLSAWSLVPGQGDVDLVFLQETSKLGDLGVQAISVPLEDAQWSFHLLGFKFTFMQDVIC